MTLRTELDAGLRVGVEEMDATHQEFADLVDRIADARGEAFTALFEELFRHTVEHFRHEESLMLECRFPAIAEHKADHERVIGDLTRMRSALGRGLAPLARAYCVEQLPGWFRTHATTMDSALAAQLKAHRLHAGGRPMIPMGLDHRLGHC